MGHQLTADGVVTDPNKVRAIRHMPTPTDVKSLKRFLGMVTYLATFLPNLSSVCEPLRRLELKNTEWCWLPVHDEAVQSIKNLVCKAPVLKFYDVKQEVTIESDASLSGLGAFLLQEATLSTNGCKDKGIIGHFRCEDKSRCISKRYICDKKADCDDGSDESNCAPPTTCMEHEWMCKDKMRCILQTRLCNGYADCADKSDESNCANIPPLKCQESDWPCKDRSRCIIWFRTCDGYPNCDDKSDESSCPLSSCPEGQWLCKDKKRCISQRRICNGLDDCLDESDESSCPIQIPGPKKEYLKCLTMGESGCDIDKCKDNNPSCETPKEYKNGFGFYCLHGFGLHYGDCRDINECDWYLCGKHAICTNTKGSYECTCVDGFYWAKYHCADIDECDTGAHTCNNSISKCINTLGSYYCRCPKGLFPMRDECFDIDECKTGAHKCDEKTSICENTNGGYFCKCRTGFNKNQDKCVGQ
ncbi:hypothetical protein ACROYT_G039217 [Oculina patagonica]